jgi:hypothetical protein
VGAAAAEAAAEKKRDQEETQAIGGRDAVSDQAAAAADVADEDIYDTYLPKKLKEGRKHPDHIVETTTLSLIEPPDITYKHHLQQVARSGALSSPQLETVVYAMQRYQKYPACKNTGTSERPGFFLGDGAGVGKGRQIAGIIFESHAIGVRRHLWLSVSSDLHYDAERDMNDVRENTSLPKLDIFPKKTLSGTLAPLAYGTSFKQQGIGDGVLFCTYSLLIGAKAGCNVSIDKERKKEKIRQAAQREGREAPLVPRPGLLVRALRGHHKFEHAQILRKSESKIGHWKVRFSSDGKSKERAEHELMKVEDAEDEVDTESSNEKLYTQLTKKGTRLDQVITWLKNGKGDDADPVSQRLQV